MLKEMLMQDTSSLQWGTGTEFYVNPHKKCNGGDF